MKYLGVDHKPQGELNVALKRGDLVLEEVAEATFASFEDAWTFRCRYQFLGEVVLYEETHLEFLASCAVQTR